MSGTQPFIVANHFHFERLLQTGNGLETYAGRDLRTNKSIVGKSASLATLSPGLLARLRHECEVLRTLYQGESRLIELVCEDERATLVTTFLEGIPLDELLRQRPLSLGHALAIARTLADELSSHGMSPADIFTLSPMSLLSSWLSVKVRSHGRAAKTSAHLPGKTARRHCLVQGPCRASRDLHRAKRN